MKYLCRRLEQKLWELNAQLCKPFRAPGVEVAVVRGGEQLCSVLQNHGQLAEQLGYVDVGSILCSLNKLWVGVPVDVAVEHRDSCFGGLTRIVQHIIQFCDRNFYPICQALLLLQQEGCTTRTLLC